MPSYVVKAAIADPRAKSFAFAKMRTMYGGKAIAVGDEIFVFASEHDGGEGLIARGIVTAVTAHAKPRGVARWTPRVSITVARTALAKRAFGREQLKAWRDVSDGSPQAELDFKFYRQATNKIGGISEEEAKSLGRRQNQAFCHHPFQKQMRPVAFSKKVWKLLLTRGVE